MNLKKGKLLKRLLLSLAILPCALVLAGCSNLTLNQYSQDIARLELVQAIGVDSGEDGITVTAEISDSEEGPKVICAGGGSVAGALERLHDFSSKERIYLAHTKHYILGEGAAEGGVGKYLDFIERDINMRISTPVFIVRGGDSYELMSNAVEAGADIALNLETFEKSMSFLSDGYAFSCADVAGNLKRNGCALVAAIEMSENSDENESGMVTVPAGYAILKDGKILNYVDAELLGGVNIFLDGMNPDILEIGDGRGNSVAFRVSVDNMRLRPIYSGKRLDSIRVDVELSASPEEVSGDIDIHDTKVMDGLCRNISQHIKNLGDEVLRLSQKLETDFLNIEKKVQIKAPIKYSRMEKPWSEVYPEMDIQLNVDTDIVRTYDLLGFADTGGESNGQ